MNSSLLKKLAAIALLAAFLLPSAPLNADSGGKLNCAANQNAPECVSPIVYGVEMRAIEAEMAINPAPDLPRLPVDDRLLYRRPFRRVEKPTTIHDAPNGNVVGAYPEGFIFVVAGNGTDGWVQVAQNAWVQESALGPINKAVSRFSGVLLPDGLPTRPFAWMLLDTRPSRTPGAKPVAGTPEIKRYTMVNIFAVAIVDTWEWYLIGPDQWVLQTRVAKIKPLARPEGIAADRKWFAVDLYEQTLTAYEGDKPVFATLIASGLPEWGTDEGVHKIFARYEETRMSGAAGKPQYWYLPLVPYVMYFNNSEQALHGAYWHDGFGYRRSRGCINLSITDAKWIYEWTQDQPDAYVYIYHSGTYRPGAPQ
jgi:hypothetical protein